MTVKWLRGDCREQMATLEAASIQTVVTSPPYWGLRDYGLPPLVWDGDFEHDHEWGPHRLVRSAGYATGEKARWNHRQNGRGETQQALVDRDDQWIHTDVRHGQWCACSAWQGSLGLEPTSELFIEHLVEVFRGVRRVLRDDGTLWLNLGDSYAGSGKGPTGHNGIGNQTERQGFTGGLQRIGPQEHTNGSGRVTGFKPKDLMMMPARVAMALQADGWWLRSMIPWLKRNAMPESVTDRPATSVEYVFLLSKSARYFWDADAVRVTQSQGTHERFGKNPTPSTRQKTSAPGSGIKNNSSFDAAMKTMMLPNGRNRRNSDWFFESWQGLMLDEQDDPLALVVNPQPFKGSHFATFPAKLVEPMVKASTRPGDTVLDCFGGAGTVGLVADRLGRNAVLCELSDSYSAMGTDRIVGDSPMFTEVVA